ncbi:hypothetical protein NG2371_05289 [Nocardia gamkensis]|nr:hypothetical protein [Nocardia gamkensis]
MCQQIPRVADLVVGVDVPGGARVVDDRLDLACANRVLVVQHREPFGEQAGRSQLRRGDAEALGQFVDADADLCPRQRFRRLIDGGASVGFHRSVRHDAPTVAVVHHGHVQPASLDLAREVTHPRRPAVGDHDPFLPRLHIGDQVVDLDDALVDGFGEPWVRRERVGDHPIVVESAVHHHQPHRPAGLAGHQAEPGAVLEQRAAPREHPLPPGHITDHAGEFVRRGVGPQELLGVGEEIGQAAGVLADAVHLLGERVRQLIRVERVQIGAQQLRPHGALVVDLVAAQRVLEERAQTLVLARLVGVVEVAPLAARLAAVVDALPVQQGGIAAEGAHDLTQEPVHRVGVEEADLVAVGDPPVFGVVSAGRLGETGERADPADLLIPQQIDGSADVLGGRCPEVDAEGVGRGGEGVGQFLPPDRRLGQLVQPVREFTGPGGQLLAGPLGRVRHGVGRLAVGRLRPGIRRRDRAGVLGLPLQLVEFHPQFPAHQLRIGLLQPVPVLLAVAGERCAVLARPVVDPGGEALQQRNEFALAPHGDGFLHDADRAELGLHHLVFVTRRGCRIVVLGQRQPRFVGEQRLARAVDAGAGRVLGVLTAESGVQCLPQAAQA